MSPKVGTSISASRLRQIPAASPVQGDVFASSLNGTDGGAGTYDEPVDSLDEVPALVSGGELVRVERGSGFQSAIDIDGEYTIESYGSGQLPEIDCTVALPSAEWSLVSSRNDVWKQTISPDTTKPGRATLYRDSDDKELTYRSDIPQDNEDFSYYVDTSSAPWVVYVNPSSSIDPSKGEEKFRITLQRVGIDNSRFDYNTPVPHSIEDLIVTRPYGHTGGVRSSAGGTWRRILVIEGAKHHGLHGGTGEDGVVQDFVMYGDRQNPGGEIGLAAYHGGSSVDTPAPQPLEIDRVLAIKTTRPISTFAHGGFPNAPTGNALINWRSDVSKFRKAMPDQMSRYGTSNAPATGDGNPTTVATIDEALNVEPGNSGARASVTYKHSVLCDQKLKDDTSGTGETVLLENCIVFVNSEQIVRDRSSNSPTIEFKNCVVVNFFGFFALDGWGNAIGDNNVLFTGRVYDEVNVKKGQSLSQLQQDTGAFANSVYLTLPQWRDFLLGDWRKGDMRVNPQASVTEADGTVRSGDPTTLPDGTPITDLGPQKQQNLSTREIEPGPPEQWRTPPKTEQECREFINAPNEWDFRGTPHDLRTQVPLGDRVVSYWPMSASSGGETDQIGSNDLTASGSPASGSTPNFDYRVFGGDDGNLDHLERPSTPALAPDRFWMAMPIRPDDTDNRFSTIANIEYTNGGALRLVYRDGSGSAVIRAETTESQTPRPSYTIQTEIPTAEFSILQVVSDYERGLFRVQVDGSRQSVNRSYRVGLRKQSSLVTIGSRDASSESLHWPGAVGPTFIADAVPSKSDMDWLYNDGSYRTLSEIQNRTVTVKEI